MWFNTPAGRAAARRALRAFRAKHGPRLTYVRNVASDGAFNFSAWKGLSYIGPVVP